MAISRFIKHLFFADWWVYRAFPKASLMAIEAAIRASEQSHVGEIRFVVEGSLPARAIWQGQTARERALDVFSQLRIWDTADNSGVLIYLLFADRSVEIVADRGIHLLTGHKPWVDICREMEGAFSKSEFLAGALSGITAVANVIGQHFPATNKRINELPDAPVVLT